VLTAVKVLDKSVALIPPGDMPVHMRAGEILEARDPMFVGRASVGVPEKAVNPDAEYLVEIALQFTRRPFPMGANRGGAFGGQVTLSVNVGGAGTLLDMDIMLPRISGHHVIMTNVLVICFGLRKPVNGK